MPLDHYVPQVHLGRFVSPSLGRLHAIRKRDGFRFSPRTKDVCRSEDGNTNAYLVEPRAVEDFLKGIEPRYNSAVDSLRGGSSDNSAVEVVSGFVAYVASCAPAAMRANCEPLRVAVEATAAIMDKRGMFPPAPESLGGATMTDLLRDGSVQIEVDRKFPQALGIGQIVELAWMLESCEWEFLHSRTESKAFVTSDFPAAIERSSANTPMNRVVPLAPDLAVRLVPGRNAITRPRGARREGSRRHRSAGGHEVVDINRTVVRCAEETVFFRDDAAWIGPFVEANREYRVRASSERIPTGRGSVPMATMVVEKPSSSTEPSL